MMLDRIIDGLKLMVMGMGSVFLFLTLMVIIMNTAAKILAPYAHLLASRIGRASSTPSPPDQEDSAMVSAAIAAVHRYRQNHQR